MNYSNEDNYTFTVDNGLYGPAIGAFVGLQAIAAITANSLVLLLTFCNPKVLKQPLIIFLTNLAIANLIGSVFLASTYAITVGAGEWIFGETIQQKIATCQVQGVIKTYTLCGSNLAFALISTDRFLFIVKPLIYKNHVKPWTAVTACIGSWMISGIIGILPILGLGMYRFESSTAVCVIDATANAAKIFIVILVVFVFACGATISVTTLWTFCFTRNFLKRLDSNPNKDSKSIYNYRVKKVFGIFGSLLTVTAVGYGLFFCLPGIRIIMTARGQEVPSFAPTIGTMGEISTTVINPIIQLYFRNDIRERFRVLCKPRH